MAANLLVKDMDPTFKSAIRQVTSAVFLGGNDTVRASPLSKVALQLTALQTIAQMEVFVLAMALHPEIQKRAQAELDGLLQGERLPTMEDKAEGRLPYCEALLKEVFRWHPITPLGTRPLILFKKTSHFISGLPHQVTQEDVYEGRRIPKGAVVVANIWCGFCFLTGYSNQTIRKGNDARSRHVR
jgi:hypothetical protein